MSERAVATTPKQSSAWVAPSRGHILQRKCACGNHATAGGECVECSSKKGALQRASANKGIIGGAPPIVHDVLSSPGQPLEPDTRAFMESRFGYDFRDVRVHTDQRAVESAKAVNANAYAVGHRVVFGRGRFAPETREGKQLLAHELAHVVQQSRGAPHITAGSSELERAAESVARDVISSNNEIRVSGASSLGIAKQDERATFGNLPQELPDPTATRIVLRQVDGVWMEIRPNGKSYRATGTYAFVIQRGKIWAVKPSGAMGANRGHTEAAAGGRVEYAGLVSFGSSQNQRGVVRDWSNASGHYLPVREFKDVAIAAGLPEDRFKAFEGPRPLSGPQAQLPVIQEKGDVTLVKADERKRAATPAGVEGPGSGKVPSATPAPAEPVSPTTPRTAPTSTLQPGSAPPKGGSQSSSSGEPALKPELSNTAATARTGAAAPGVPAPKVGSQGQRVYGGAQSRPVEIPESNRAAAAGAAVMALMMAMDKLNEIGKEVQNEDARTKLLSVRQEIIDVLHREPGIGAVIELQFLEPEHRFQDIYWARTTAANAGKPTIVANPEARQPKSTFIYVEPMRSAQPGGAPTGPVTKEAKSGEEFVTLYVQARGGDVYGTGATAVEMYDALQRGNRQFGFTDVQAGAETIRISDAARASIDAAVASLAERYTQRRLTRLKGGIDKQQGRLSEKMKDWFGGAIHLTGHELDPARAHFAAAENYARDKKFGPANASIDAGEAQVEEVWAALYEYEYGHRPAGPPIW
jgi:hypothetical protein